MKRSTKILINIQLIIIAVLGYLISLNNSVNHDLKNLRLFSVFSFIMFFSIIYLIASSFHKYNRKEVLKEKTITIIICFMVITFIYTYVTTNLLDKLDNTTYIKNPTPHGRYYLVSDKQLKTVRNIRNYTINEDLQKNPEDYEYKVLFDKSEVADVYIDINRNNYDYLLQNALDKPTVMTDKVTINDYSIEYTGIKTKGFSTLYEIYNSEFDRFSYTINFSKYINKKNGYSDKQNLLGVRKISLNTMLWDPTYLKEYLSYYLLTEMGIPTSDYNLANLYINNQYKGLYFMVEGIDKALVKRTLHDNSDFTVKVDVNGGGDLIYDEILDKFIDEDGEYNFDKLIYDEDGNIIYPKNNILAKYNGIWEDDEEKFEEVIPYLSQFFKTLKELNELSKIKNKNTKEYEERLEKIIDIDLLIRYWAVNSYLVNTDSYLGKYPTNYVIHMTEDGYITILPWDYNLAFGGIYIKDAQQMVNFSIDKPYIETNLQQRPLLNVILSNKKYKKQYEKYLKDITIITTDGGTTSLNKEYPKNNFKQMIENKKDYIVEQQEKDKETIYNTDKITRAHESLIKVVELRSKAVNNQLKGNDKKIKTDIPITATGNKNQFGNIKKD